MGPLEGRFDQMTALSATSEISLRPVRRSDLPLLAEWHHDPDIRRVTRDWRALTEAEQEQWFQRISGPERRSHMFVVERANDGLPVGLVGLVHWSLIDGTAELSFFTGLSEARRQGYARGAVILLLNWGFEVMRLERVVAEVYEFNEASLRLLTSVGFVAEGRLRSHVHRDGRRWDAIVMGLLRDEWRHGLLMPHDA